MTATRILVRAAAPRPAPAVDEALRCWRCDKKLAEFAARPWRIICCRCRAENRSG